MHVQVEIKRLLSSREKDENKKALEMKSLHYDHQGCLMQENCIDQHFDPIICSIIVQGTQLILISTATTSGGVLSSIQYTFQKGDREILSYLSRIRALFSVLFTGLMRWCTKLDKYEENEVWAKTEDLMSLP